MTIDVPQSWFLEGFLDDSERLWRTPLTASPFSVGRSPMSDLVLAASAVSQRHAELQLRGLGELWVVDRGSSNGTFVNGQRLEGETLLRAGDLLRFADQEFRVCLSLEMQPEGGGETLKLSMSDFQPQLLAQGKALEELLEQRAVTALFQPLVDIKTHRVVGYEQLGRGNLGGELKGPGELFPVAETLGMARRLSELFRQVGLEDGRRLPADQLLFVNTHPCEVQDPKALLEVLTLERRHSPDRALVLEIHESAVTDLESFRNLHRALLDLDIPVAFDDFGTGQARWIELAEATPRYLKFDILWLSRGRDSTSRRKDLLVRLLNMAKDLEILTVLEGVETEEDAAFARALDFDLVQGYFFGRPAPVEDFE